MLLIFLLSVISLIFYMIYYDIFRRSGTETYGWKVAGRSVLPLLLDPMKYLRFECMGRIKGNYYPRGLWAGCRVIYLWSFALWFVYKIHGLLWGWFFNVFESTSHAAFIPLTWQNAIKLSKSWLLSLLSQRLLNPCLMFLSCLRFSPFFLLFFASDHESTLALF